MNVRIPGATDGMDDAGLGPRRQAELPPLGSAAFLRTFGQPLVPAAPLAEAKRANVAEASEVKRLMLGGADDLRRLGTAIREGNDLGQSTEAQIIASGNPYDILTRLGPDAAGAVEPLYRQMRDDAFALDQGRTAGEITGDAVLGIGAGAISGLGGLGALGVGLINDQGGAAVSEAVDWAAGGLRDWQSQGLQDQRAIGQVRSTLDQEDIDRQYARDVADGVSYAGLRRFGREALAAGQDLIENPALAGDMVAEGVGSLIAGGGLGQVAAVGAAKLLLRGRGIVGEAAEAYLRSPEGRQMLAELTERGMPAVIGGLEAGGTYAGIQSEIRGMSEGDLLETSPEYRALRAGGMGHDAARDRIANLAGLEGGAITGLIGAATGSLVARFEANPLILGRGSDSLVSALRSIGRESLAQGVEEGAQGAVSTLATDLAIRNHADETRDLTRGIGGDLVRGAVAGVGMVAPLRAPDLMFGAAQDVGRGIGLGRDIAERAVTTRLANVEAGIDAESPVGRSAMDRAVVRIQTGMETLRQSAAVPAPNESKNESADPSLETLGQVAADALELDPEGLAQIVRQMENGELSPQDAADTALDIHERVARLEAISATDMQRFKPDVQSALRDIREAANVVLSNPTVAEALDRARTVVSETDLGPMPEVTAETAESPEVRKAVTQTLRLAEANPAGIDPRFVGQVLNQRTKFKLSDAVRAKLQAAALIVREMEEADRKKAEIAATTKAELARQGIAEKVGKPSSLVRDEIRNTGGKDPYRQYSLSRHQAEIVGALGRGDMAMAQERLDALRSFGQHMALKVQAAERSAAMKKSRDNAVPFRTWTGMKWLEPGEKGASSVFINPYSPTSMQLLKDIRVDAATVQAVYNNILGIYGPVSGLKGKPLAQTPRARNVAAELETPRQAEPTAEASQQNEGADRQEQIAEAPADEPEAGDEVPAVAMPAEAVPSGKVVDQPDTAESEDSTNPEPSPQPAAGVIAPDFSNLPSVAGATPKFVATFAIDPEASPLMLEAVPARKVLEIFRKGDTADERYPLPYAVDQGQLQLWSRLVAKEGGDLIDRVNARLRLREKAVLKNLRNQTPLEALAQVLAGQAPVNWLEQRDTLGLNLVDPANGEYDLRLVQLAMLGSLHWVMTTSGTQNMEDEEVAKLFGVEVAEVTEMMRHAANSGRGVKPSVESLARTIREFWGAEGRPEAPISDVRGLSEHMAIQFLAVMEGPEGRFTTSETFEVADGDGKVRTARVIYLRNEATKDIRDDLRGSKSLIGDVFVPQAKKPFYFGTPPEDRRQTQKGNSHSPLGDDMRTTLKVQRETPFFRNTPQLQMMKALGQDTWFDLMGFRAVNPGQVNVMDRLSIDGLNNSIRDSWDGVMAYDAQLEGHAALHGKPADEVPVYFDYYSASNERMMIDGFNPQADKGLREAAIATRATLNLADEAQHQAFWLTVGQSSGLVKTEKNTRAANAAEAEAKVRARFPESIGILASWLSDPAQPIPAEQRAVLVSEIRAALGDGKASPKLMHALLSVARYDVAMADAVPGDMTAIEAFRHDLSLEADGKTDGPVNAIVNFTTGDFTVPWILNVRRGGFFPGEAGQTLNRQFERDGADLYEVAGARANARFAERRLEMSRSRDGAAMMGALQRVLGLLGDVEIGEDGHIRIARAGVKNPLTITGYGSGEAGIAGKVTGLMLDKLYAGLTRMEEARVEFADPQIGLDWVFPALGSLDQFRKDLTLLTRRRLVWDKDEGWVFTARNQKGQEAGPLMDLSKGRDFKLSPEQWSMLQTNIRTGYVKPMRAAIAEVFGNAQRTLELFQTATQVQSLVLKALFQKRLKEVLAEKRASGSLKPGQFLSQQDFAKISDELKRYGAFIEPVTSDDHSLNLSISEGEQSPYDFSRDFDGRYGGSSTLPMPRLAGVSAAPMVTISRGDAKMMVNFYSRAGAVEAGAQRTLQVFDGLEMPADQIEGLSERINQAVSDAWLENPARDVAQGFSDWLRQGKDGPLGQLSEDDLGPVAEVLGVDGTTQAEVEAALLALDDELAQAARSIQARKNVLKRIGYSVDHMASGETPFVKEGETWSGEGRFLDWMNGLYAEELAKLPEVGTTERASERPAVEPADKATRKLIDETGLPVRVGSAESKTTVSRLTMAQLVAIVGRADMPGMTDDRRAILQELSRILPDYSLMVGDKDALTEWRAATYPELDDPMEIDLGQTDPSIGVIFISNPSAETILHELLHGALGAVLTNHYARIGPANDTRAAAIGNLERLMAQFVNMDFRLEAPGIRKAAAQAQAEIRNWLGEHLEFLAEDPGEGGDLLVLRKSGAMSEFIAWTLTNQNLQDVLSTSKVKSRLIRLKDAALAGLRRLLGLPDKAPLDVFSNIKWNTAALLRTVQGEPEAPLAAGLRQNQRNPDRANTSSVADDRMRRVRQSFEAKVAAHLRAMPPTDRVNEELGIYTLADEAVNRFRAAGFRFTAEQESTFRVIQAAMASSMKIAPGAMSQVQKVFDHFMKGLTVESLMADHTDDFERGPAEEKFNAIVGKTGTEWDRYGRSNLMSSVLALAIVSEDFRNILEKTGLPKDRKINTASVDDFLTSATESMISTLGTAISESGLGNSNTREALDRLALVLARIEDDDRSWIEKAAFQVLDGGDAKARSLMEGFGTRLVDWSRTVEKPGDNSSRLGEVVREGLAGGARLLASVVSESRGQAIAEAMTSFANESRSRLVPTVFKEMLAEVIGATDTNRGVLDLVNRVKTQISALRQDYREKLPEILARQFSRKLEEPEWSALHLGLGKTDVAVLGDAFSAEDTRKLLSDDGSRTGATRSAEEEIRRLGRRNAPVMLKKADELAMFMVTGRIDPGNLNFLKNARAIANLFGERGQKDLARSGGASDDLVRAIDQYTSLRALEILKTERGDVWARLMKLAADEPAGFDFLLYSLVDLRKTEVARLNTPASRMNAWKGYIPEEAAEGARLIVADDREHNKLIRLGFTRLGGYAGSGFERGSQGYYFSTVGGNSPYAQGVLQTIQRTAMGTDPVGGRNTSGLTGGVLSGPQVATIQSLMRTQPTQGAGEPLIPLYNDKGQVVAFERSLWPEMRARMNRNDHMGQMMGAWAGRQEEERLAQAFNELLIDRLKTVWDEGKKTHRKKEFLNLSDPLQQDEVFGESWSMIPAETKAYIAQVFGEEGFMVRRDMVNNALGYRMPSVKDLWDGASRLDPKARRMLRNAATVVIGKRALTTLVTAEKLWAAGISVTKNTIVVRSVIVPLSNMASNVLQLMSRGVGLREIWRGMPAKLVEITQFLKNRDREIEIRALLARHRDDTLRTLKLTAELKSIEDANMRMSIWPLIEAGEFSTIAEGQTEVDAAISEGKWSEYLQNILDKVPARLGTLGRYAMVTRDTALFRGMSRAVQYGDFLAKAVLFDHLVEKQGMAAPEAMKRVTEEFVNYNFLPGRTRSYLENMGVTWFWAYKLRSMKVALNMIRENPLRAMLMTHGAEYLPNVPGVSVGSPLGDNAANVVLEGRADYSLGLDMLWAGPGLNPWVHLAS